MLLLIFLTAASLSGCKHKDVPPAPKVLLYQPLINVKVCSNGECQIINKCKIYEQNEKKEWILISTEELAFCNGIFGVNSKDFVTLRDYSRTLETWIGKNCGSTSNGQPQTAP